MSARNYLQTLGAGETARLPAGRYFYIRQATSGLNITTEGNPGSPLRFDNISAGSKFGPVSEGQGWRVLVVQSPEAQTIEIAISDDGNFEIAASVTVAGVAQVSELPASAIANTAPVSLANAAETQIVAANLSRRRVTVQLASTGGGSVFLRSTPGGNNLYELQPGTSYTFAYTGELRARNDTGAAINCYVLEES